MLQMCDVSKSYGKLNALNKLNLTLRESDIYGLVGPENSGKTTATKIMAGVLRPDEGKIIFESDNNNRYTGHKLKSLIGYLPDDFGIYDNLKVIEYMTFFARLYGFGGRKGRTYALEQLDRVGLYEQVEDYVELLSKANLRKLGLARSLINGPKVLIMDEPFTGLDAVSRVEFQELLFKLQDEGKTILLTSHKLQDISKICTSIGIINNGHMEMEGSYEDIMHKKSKSNPITIRITKNLEKAMLILRDNPNIKSIAKKEQEVYIQYTGSESEEAKLLGYLVTQEIGISAFYREESDFDALYFRITEEDKNDFTAI